MMGDNIKINIAIELCDHNIENMDLSTPENGNPGIGGSEWMFLLLGRYLKNRFSDKYRVTIYHYSINQLPDGLGDWIVSDHNGLIKALQDNNENIIVHQINRDLTWYERIQGTKLIDIPWAHCYLSYPEVNAINRSRNVGRVVFVGREEYDAYIDDEIIKKSCFVYNMLNTKTAFKRSNNYENNVFYMGSLVEGKAFHLLAEIWPDILKRVPSAQLFVAGTGKLYDRNAKLGKYGIAEENYENRFMTCLVDNKDNILESVHFLGILGRNKEEVMEKIAVGVVNPSGKDETFCLSAVEMELCGIPVVTVKKYGLLDTVKDNRTGFLFKTKKQFVRKIVKLLNDKNLNSQLGSRAIEFVKQSFEADQIIREWDVLLDDVYHGRENVYYPPKENFRNDFKWVKIMIRFLRINCGIKLIPSFVKMKYSIKSIMRNR